jgi:hypothetical protein
MSEPLTIRKLVDRISSGDIRIPAFQRDFVWEPDQVAFLLDSIYKEFPIGTIILWRTDNRLRSEKRLGHFTLPEPRKDYPVNYVLDGQQRLTSLFSVFQTDLTPDSHEWTNIFFDMHAEESVQESLFLALEEAEVDPERHFSVKTLFDTVSYRQATSVLVEGKVKKIDELQSKFKEYLIPNETFESDDRNKVAIVFERINRAGTELNVFELLSAWSWSDDFDLVEKFETLQDGISDHGFDELCNDKDLQLRICAGVITGETTPKKILDLQGEDIRSRFSEIENGILGTLDFLKREANVKHYKMIPFPGLLVPLSSFFATEKSEGFVYTDLQKQKLLKWFWRSLFNRRFSSDVNQRQAQDISEMLKLKVNENHDFKFPKSEIKFEFQKSNFSAGNANSRSHILLLNSMTPYSFLSGARIDTDKILKKSSKHEFHHIYPRKHLERLGKERNEINVLANICFLTRGDNNQIKDKSPSDYLGQIDPVKKGEYMKNALCPSDFAKMDYEEFIEERSKLLILRANELMA